MAAVPDIKFTRSGTVDIAYQIVGDGPLDIVLMIGWVSHLEMLWELPGARHFVERFAAMGRVVLFDKRGTGLSDRPSDQPSAADMVPDARTVMDAAGMESAVLVGWVDAVLWRFRLPRFIPTVSKDWCWARHLPAVNLTKTTRGVSTLR